MGYLPKDDKYRMQFEKEFNNPICFENTTSVDTAGVQQYTILNIGDSFSLQGGFSYGNYLCMSDSFTLLNHHAINPLEMLYGFIHSDFFNRVSVRYVILQSVERDFVFRSEFTDRQKKISFNEAINEIRIKPEKKNYHFLNNAPSCVLRYNVMRYFKKNADVSHVYSFQISDSSLFTWRNKDEILIFSNDLLRNPSFNTASVAELNHKLNELSALLAEKNITLIVLPAPDKYTIYYDYLQIKNTLPEPKFFKYFDAVEKNYIYIHANDILKNAVSAGIKDVYLADDSHWSPSSSRMIAEAIRSEIRKAENR
jgi:hypothetical protein